MLLLFFMFHTGFLSFSRLLPYHDTPEYYAKLKELDGKIAQIVQAVQAAGIYEETVFILPPITEAKRRDMEERHYRKCKFLLLCLGKVYGLEGTAPVPALWRKCICHA